MNSKLKSNPTILNLIRQYEVLPPRDRAALKGLSVVMLLVVLYFLAWVPAYSYMKDAKVDLESGKQLLALVNENKNILGKTSKGQGAKASRNLDSQQLVSSVTNIARQQGLTLKRFEPSGGNKLKVWVDNAAFDKVATWLNVLKKNLGVTVDQITIEKDDAPGLVSARLTLSS